MNTSRSIAVTLLPLLLAACAVGPDYKRPALPVPAAFKEVAGWKRARPSAAVNRGDWWTIYRDPELDKLMVQLNAANQDIAAAAARYRQAHALVQSARASFLPTLTANAGLTRSGSNTASVTSAGSASQPGIITERSATLDASWELDVWGRVRRDVEASAATARASAADLASARLSAQAELAMDYFQLRVLDAQQQLYEHTVAAYRQSLQMTRNRYAAGVVSRADVVQAQTQLQSALTQATDNHLQRVQLEHAVAVLLGKPPEAVDLKQSALTADAAQLADLPLPAIPATVPSSLLERRPDIAGAEQRVIAANANVGVAEAAYFPSLTLSATGGYRSTSAADWLTAPNRFWSVGPSLLVTLFDDGAHTAAVRHAEAAYDETVATYRQTVLTAFQDVEDNLAALALLQQEAQSQDAAVQAARESTRIVTNQYRVGKVAYLNVITAQATEFSNEQTALKILGQRYSASIKLIKALGGSWQAQSADAATAGP